uniref:Ubiquinol oxidase n=1 Tax=Chromera velia CCMP2878 TaxID=1169474 RepID=A0A0G4HAL7_9ALVE|eukprot:Cvel_25704.t1-p1 / transcript=Cvel_25704.t1 / gene=Cvel_25704 / organism=Chromera_velia_CCMP2878 / gene_product=Ubiquinol oxidase 4, chloroplastic/chromoplastic, putative / transcript_product=Ubiquinol oxidase 4, chloroplastic/chromoplastic, putative / location=Cvel_scaffold2949:10392-12437(-) / protein_length=469 / sequence_SO=supercontig / SO=protein_coding / is_pseudo=false
MRLVGVFGFVCCLSGRNAVGFSLKHPLQKPTRSKTTRSSALPKVSEKTEKPSTSGASSRRVEGPVGGLLQYEPPSPVLKDRFKTYGYFTRTAGNPEADVADGDIPANFFVMGTENFRREFDSLRRSVRFNEYERLEGEMRPLGLSRVPWQVVRGFLENYMKPLDVWLEDKGLLPELLPWPELAWLQQDEGAMEEVVTNRKQLAKLALSNSAIWDREKKREAERVKIRGPPNALIYFPYLFVCVLLDVVYDGRPIQRFWFLETVARMPYFAYASVLHLYESLGWFRGGTDLRKLHAAEEWNEMHHLLIMESLGGDKNWIDRFLAQHAAVLYYWVLVVFYLFSPRLSYLFSELLEGHAVDTYSQFLEENGETLKTLPPPKAAVDYYVGADLYLFDSFQNPQKAGRRRPSCESLFDVFQNICEDEGEHVKTMIACEEREVQKFIKGQKRSLAMAQALKASDPLAGEADPSVD